MAVNDQWIRCAAGVRKRIQLSVAKNRERGKLARRKVLLVNYLARRAVCLLRRIPDSDREIAVALRCGWYGEIADADGIGTVDGIFRRIEANAVRSFRLSGRGCWLLGDGRRLGRGRDGCCSWRD